VSKPSRPTSLSRRSSLALRASVVGFASLIGLSLVGHAQVPVGVQEPAWSPDGKRIAVSYLDRIWTMTPDGKQARAMNSPSLSSVARSAKEGGINFA
jgi:hypothetical protein